MPIDREAWARQLHLSNFVNTYYQYRDLQSLSGVRKVLVIGPGQGLDTQVLRWVGYEVVTFDIDGTFSPDIIGSVHDLSRFGDGEFDASIASHVLEHMAEPYLDAALAGIARVSPYALIYLPVAGRHPRVRLTPNVTQLDLSLGVDLFNFFNRPSSNVAKYAQGQHFWEIGRPGFSLPAVRRRLEKHFTILRDYRNRDWLDSHNFVVGPKP